VLRSPPSGADDPIESVSTGEGTLVNKLLRRIAAATVAVALMALVACDLWIGGFRDWWDRHSLTGSVVSNLLVLAVTALIVDEVVARRQRRERAESVAVQGLIVYAQARRANDALTATTGPESPVGAASDELRTLASMLLTASPSLFDDPVARRFLEQAERFSALMLRLVSASSHAPLSPNERQRLASEMSDLETTMKPLLARIPTGDGTLFGGDP
jgi:hypothetical protein